MIRTPLVSRTATRLAIGGILAALAAGCSAAPAPAPPTGTPPTATPSSAPGPADLSTDPAAPGPAGNPERCTSAELTGSIGGGEGAAGSTILTVLLTNNGERTCELTGFPGVSYVTGADGHQVGTAARMVGARGGPVELAVGEAAATLVKQVNAENFDPAACQPTPVRGLRIYPPGDTASLFLAAEGTGCAGTPPGDQLSVETLTKH